jgi:short-subunit dehydrogenase
MIFIVTGAGSGIGYQAALHLSQVNNSKVIAISRNKTNLEKLRKQGVNEESAGEIIPFPCDLLTLQVNSFSELFKRNKITSIDGLVNNAGLLINKPFEKLSDEEFKSIYEVNVFGAVRLIRMLLPYLKKAKRPHIVNISSLGGFQGSSKFAGLSAYSSSKAALACLSECLAVEFAKDKIAVNALCLGAVDTEMLQRPCRLLRWENMLLILL